MDRLASQSQSTIEYETLRVRKVQEVLYIQIFRPEENNTINDILITEMESVLETNKDHVKVVVLQGLPKVFCFGADFNQIVLKNSTVLEPDRSAELLYNIWLNLALGPFISIAQVKGKTNAGGVGFVAACDIVLCEESAEFSLSELLFGLMPACVLPFLIRRIGQSKANYMTLMTQPVSSEQAHSWGLVDAIDKNVDNLLRKHLLRLVKLDKTSIAKHKSYINTLNGSLVQDKELALVAYNEVFSNVKTIKKITKYIETGEFPWEQ
jgi:polyketide biosynthesis enoyl-CoA hydratase PksH